MGRGWLWALRALPVRGVCRSCRCAGKASAEHGSALPLLPPLPCAAGEGWGGVGFGPSRPAGSWRVLFLQMRREGPCRSWLGTTASAPSLAQQGRAGEGVALGLSRPAGSRRVLFLRVRRESPCRSWLGTTAFPPPLRSRGGLGRGWPWAFRVLTVCGVCCSCRCAGKASAEHGSALPLLLPPLRSRGRVGEGLALGLSRSAGLWRLPLTAVPAVLAGMPPCPLPPPPTCPGAGVRPVAGRGRSRYGPAGAAPPW